MTDHRAFWSRVFTYIPTPTKDDGETVDETRLRQVIDFSDRTRLGRDLRIGQHWRERLVQ
jgi:hypothetical protein